MRKPKKSLIQTLQTTAEGAAIAREVKLLRDSVVTPENRRRMIEDGKPVIYVRPSFERAYRQEVERRLGREVKGPMTLSGIPVIPRPGLRTPWVIEWPTGVPAAPSAARASRPAPAALRPSPRRRTRA